MTYFIEVRDTNTKQVTQRLEAARFRQYCEQSGGFPRDLFLNDLIERYNQDQSTQHQRFGSSQYAELVIK